MTYTMSEARRMQCLRYYYLNKKKILKYQTARLMKKYATDPEYRAKKALRDKTIREKNRIRVECIICFSKYQLQYHHEDYGSSKADVLCKKCHDFIHRLERA